MKVFVPYLALLLYCGTSLAHAFPGSSGVRNIARNDASHDVLAPRASGGACEDRCKKKCRGRRVKDPNDCRRCVPCAPGKKPDPDHNTCISDGNSNDDENKKRCPDGAVPDPKQGPQELDATTFYCTIDDQKDCKPPKLSETRPNGKENDGPFKPKCLDPDENDKTKCDEKKQFAEVSVGPNGKAKKTCRPTRQYQDKKKSRWSKMKDKFKAKWENDKGARKDKEEARKDRSKKIQEGRKKKAQDKKKRIKSYKCGMATAIEVGQEIAGLIPTDSHRRRDGNKDIESYMDMVACYFDVEFVQDDQFLEYFPSDVNVDEIGTDIVGVTVPSVEGHSSLDQVADVAILQDEKAYMEAFMTRLENADFDFWKNHDFCRRRDNGTLSTRCTKRAAVKKRQVDYAERLKLAERALKRDILPRELTKRDETFNADDFCDMKSAVKRSVAAENSVEKRNPLMIFVEIALTAARMATSLASRVIPRLVTYSPRLAKLLDKTPKNLFKLAPKGSTAHAGSREAMKQAFRKLANHPAFKQCVRSGKPA